MPRAGLRARFSGEQCARGQNICSPVPSPVLPYHSDRLHRRVGTLTRLYRHDGHTVHHGATRAIAVPPTRRASRFLATSRRQASRFLATSRRQTSRFLATSRRQTSRFLANAGQRRRQRRAVGAGSTQRRNRPTSKGHRVRVSSVVDDAPHHTPAAPRLKKPQTPVRPRHQHYTPVTYTHTHLSPTSARICATKLCNADT